MRMPESEPRRIGINVEVKPHAYDPAVQPELFEGVLARRVIAFLIDVIIIGAAARAPGDLHVGFHRLSRSGSAGSCSSCWGRSR